MRLQDGKSAALWVGRLKASAAWHTKTNHRRKGFAVQHDHFGVGLFAVLAEAHGRCDGLDGVDIIHVFQPLWTLKS